MAKSRLSIPHSVAMAYGDALRVILAMRTLVLCAVIIVLAVKVAEDLIPMRAWSGPILGGLLGLVTGAVQSFCLTPIIIAVHRFIILDEVAPGYVIDVSQPSFIPFFLWLVALSVLTAVVFSVQELLTATGLSVTTAFIPTSIVLVAVLIVTLRLTILFPAIAVDAGGAHASNALADTKGHVFSIFMIFLLTLLPCAAFDVAIVLVLGPGVLKTGTPLAMVNLVIGAVIQTFIAILCVAIASRVFQALAARVLRPA